MTKRDLVIRTMRDYFTPDIDEVWVDHPDTYERALEFVKDVMPTKAKVLKLYTGDRPLFAKFNLEEQIESIYKRRVPLRSGGEIVIDGTEALTAIDVNSKGAPRQGGSEDNAVSTNLEAAAEILRRRDHRLGGLGHGQRGAGAQVGVLPCVRSSLARIRSAPQRGIACPQLRAYSAR